MRQMENFEHPAFGGTIELRYGLRQRCEARMSAYAHSYEQTKEFIRISPEGFQITVDLPGLKKRSKNGCEKILLHL